jgi:hypothetical protein
MSVGDRWGLRPKALNGFSGEHHTEALMSKAYLDSVQLSKLADLIALNNLRKIPFRAIKSVLGSWGFGVRAKADVEELIAESVRHAKELRVSKP